MLFIVVTVTLCSLILFLILFLNIKLGIEYLKFQKIHRLYLIISFSKDILKIKIPIIDSERRHNKWSFLFRRKKKRCKIDEETLKEQDAEISFDKIKDTSEKAYDIFNKYLDILIAFYKYTKKKIKCESFCFRMNYGLGDAALTGISTGMLWGVIYSLLGVLDRYFEFIKMDVNINPDFNDIKLQLEFDCIFKIKIVHIIIVIFIVLYTFIKSVITKKSSPQNCVAG